MKCFFPILNVILFLAVVSWSRDLTESNEEIDKDGGIYNTYDDWKDPHNPLGMDYEDEDEEVRAPQENTNHTTEQQQSGEKDGKKHDPSPSEVDFQRKSEELETCRKELKQCDGNPIVEDVAYFKHFMRVFSQHMQPLQGEEYKFGAQVMMKENDFDELYSLLQSEDPNCKQILDTITTAFVPLSRSPLVQLKPFLDVQFIGMSIGGLIVAIAVSFIVQRMLMYPLSILRNVAVLFFILFLFSVPWEWYRMYQKALSDKTANSMKLSSIPDACKPHTNLSALDSLIIWAKDKFSMADDECLKYHETLLVDPFWEVTPFQAISVCASRFFLEPMKVAASASGQCFRLFFKEVPVQWQPFVFIAGCFFVALFLLTQSGLEIWTPLVRLGVRPRGEVANYDRLQRENERLRIENGDIRVELQRRRAIDGNNVAIDGCVEEIGIDDANVQLRACPLQVKDEINVPRAVEEPGVNQLGDQVEDIAPINPLGDEGQRCGDVVADENNEQVVHNVAGYHDDDKAVENVDDGIRHQEHNAHGENVPP